MELEQLQALVIDSLDNMKAQNITVLDVRGKSTITDLMIIATGTSSRHVRSLAMEVARKSKDAGHAPLGEEGNNGSEWVLVDLHDIIVHVMTAQSRDFYNLEKLWGVSGNFDQAYGQALAS